MVLEVSHFWLMSDMNIGYCYMDNNGLKLYLTIGPKLNVMCS
jgi:hypothetical protein